MACCNEHSRSEILRRGLAEAGRGLPAIEPGMPMPAGTGLDRRTFLARGAGLALAVYGGAALGPQGVRRGDRGGCRGGPAAEGARLGLPRRRRRLALAPRADGRSALSPAPTAARARRGRRAGVHRGPAPDLASVARPARPAPRRGQGQRHARDRLRRSEPVALHLAALLGGRRGRRAPRDRLARSLPRPCRQARQPAPGAVARLEPPAVARDGEDARRRGRRARPVRLLGSRRLGRGVGRGWSTTIGRLGALPTHGDPGLEAGERGGDAVGTTLRAADAVPAEGRSQVDRQPGRLSRRATTASRGASPASPRCSRPGCRCASSRSRRPAATTRTTTRRRSLSDDLKLTADSLLAFQRDLEARGLADRVLVHVWTEFGRRAKENGSGGTDHGAAGAGFLIGSQVSGQMIGEFPGLGEARRAGQSPRDERLPWPLRRDPRGLARDRRRGDHPGRAEVRASEDPAMRLRLAAALLLAARTRPGRDGRRTRTGAPAGLGRRVQPRPLTRLDPEGSGDHRARQLRRGRPRSRAPARRRHADVPDRRGRAGTDRLARGAPPRRVDSRSGARSPITAPAGCARR